MSVNHNETIATTGLVPEQEMAQQQQDAHSQTNALVAAHSLPDPTPAATNSLEHDEPKDPTDETETSVFNSLTATLMVTLDLSQDFMVGLKKPLSAVDDGNGALHNLYAPFRRGGKPVANITPSPEGVLRGVLSEIFDITDKINDSKIMFVGEEAQIKSKLANVISRTRRQLENLLPIACDAVVAELAPEDPDADEEEDGQEITFGDLVKISSWVNSPQTTGLPHEVDLIAAHNAVINITVNVGALYDAEEKVKYLGQVESSLRMLHTKRENVGSTALVFGVLLNPADLSSAEVRDFLDTLLTDKGYELFSRNQLHDCVIGWLPATKVEVDYELLSRRGDLLLAKLLDDAADDDSSTPTSSQSGAEAE